MLKQRVITAALLIPAFLVIVFYFPSSTIAWLFLGILLLGGWEWSQLIGLSQQKSLFYLLALAGCSLVLSFSGVYLPLFYMAVLFWVLAIVGLIFIHFSPNRIDKFKYCKEIQRSHWDLTTMFVGVMVLVPAWGAVVYLSQQPGGRELIFVLFVLVWTADIAAYFCGKAWGRRKLSLALSPGKSWEGVLGGSVFVIGIGLLVINLLPLGSKSNIGFLILCAILSVFSVAGDLFQSLLKRICGVKDSGQILPGHGGILDRIDSITAVAPIYVLGLSFLGMLS